LRLLILIDQIIGKTLKWITCTCLLLVSVQLTVGIIVRYFRLTSIARFDELVELFFCWIIFFGAALVVRDWSHLRVEFLELLLPRGGKAAKYLRFMLYCLSLLFVLFFVKSGIVLFSVSGAMSSEMLRLPRRLWYLPIPVSGLLMVAYISKELVGVVLDLRKGNKLNNQEEKR